MVKPADLTTLGRIGAAHGVRGWVRLISFTDPAANILDFRHFYLSPGAGNPAGQLEKIEIDESRAQGKHFIGHIKGCDDRDLTRKYTGRELQVEKASLPDLNGEDGYYWFQLEGLQVINLQDECLGHVHHLIETGANDVLVVRSATGDVGGDKADDSTGDSTGDSKSIDDEERLIPYIQDQVIKEVDLDSGIIRVDWQKDY